MEHRMLSSLLFLGLAMAAGCATPGQRERGDSRELLPAEIATAPVVNMYEAIDRLRPRWLAGRGREIVVFYNDRYVGGVETLREYRTTTIARARFLNAAEAAATLPLYDIRRSGGAIVLEPLDGG